jgi:5-methylcytosine-specific restriction endonuclease McrA
MNDFQPRRPRLRLNPDSYRKLRTEVLKRDGWRCQYCSSSDRLQVTTFCSRSLLGDDRDENLITLCADCHSDIHPKLPQAEVKDEDGTILEKHSRQYLASIHYCMYNAP